VQGTDKKCTLKNIDPGIVDNWMNTYTQTGVRHAQNVESEMVEINMGPMGTFSYPVCTHQRET
jgi:hypothetical protein